ncbi:MAG: hypothetical protein JO303_07560 [Caulobacteraceae bacterium]|nr:hypothetical protein [Caulobacteraceae bacterium]
MTRPAGHVAALPIDDAAHLASPWASRAILITRSMAVIVLGLVCPVALLLEAYLSVQSIANTIADGPKLADYVATFTKAKPTLTGPYDYAMFSQMFSESVNQTVILHKQIMKLVTVQIGFAAMCLGLMFVVLGINDGGGEAGVRSKAITWDFRTASTGALVFAIGAAMTAAGGLIPNQYTTVGLPGIGASYQAGSAIAQSRLDKSIEDYRLCKAKASPGHFGDCFATLFFQANEAELK